MFKQLWTIIRKAIHFKKIGMIIITACVFLPCAVEAKSVEPPKAKNIFSESLFVLGELPFDFSTVSGSNSEQDVFELVSTSTLDFVDVDGATEWLGCLYDFNSSFTINNQSMRRNNAKPTENNSDRPKNVIAKEIAQLFPMVFLFLVAIWMILQSSPNKKITEAQARSK